MACSHGSASSPNWSRRSASPAPRRRPPRTALAAIETALDAAQKDHHAESLAFASQQRRCHDLELELLQLQQAAEAAAKRRAQLAQELADVHAQEATEQQQVQTLRAELADAQSRLHDEIASSETRRGMRATRPT